MSRNEHRLGLQLYKTNILRECLGLTTEPNRKMKAKILREYLGLITEASAQT